MSIESKRTLLGWLLLSVNSLLQFLQRKRPGRAADPLRTVECDPQFGQTAVIGGDNSFLYVTDNYRTNRILKYEEKMRRPYRWPKTNPTTPDIATPRAFKPSRIFDRFCRVVSSSLRFSISTSCLPMRE